jgi:mRNA interferase MazF
MEIARGDVVICAAPGDYGKPRPAVVVQSDLFNSTHSSVAVCLITSHLEDAPLFRIPVPVSRSTGLKVSSQVMVDKIIAIPRNKITQRTGVLSSVTLKEVENALRLWLELVSRD